MGELATTFRWAKDGNTITTIPKTRILSDQYRPHLSKLEPGVAPIIDLSEPDEVIKAKIKNACHDYGVFYLVNHGVDEALCKSVLDAIVEFFTLPLEQGRAQFKTTKDEAANKEVKLISYEQPDGGQIVPGWSESFAHLWHPTDDAFLDDLPPNPPRYREQMRKYAKEMGILVSKVLGYMSEGLGLPRDALETSMGDMPKYYKMQTNFYPPCPDPELTIGLPVHNDMTALTIVRQTEHTTGLHFLKDDLWYPLTPRPNAFVCNVGDVMEILTNGKYKSVRHRAVTSKENYRVSLATFIAPNKQSIVGPIKDLVDEEHPARYETFVYKDFHERIVRPWLFPELQPSTGNDKAV